MARRNVVQVLLSDAEIALAREAAQRCRTAPASQARVLLLAWVDGALHRRGGVRGGACGSTNGCTNEDAVWYNTNTFFFTCASCAEAMNKISPGCCVLGAGPQQMPQREIDALYETKVQREDLVDAVVKAANTLAAYDARAAVPALPKPHLVGWTQHPDNPAFYFKDGVVKSEAELAGVITTETVQ